MPNLDALNENNEPGWKTLAEFLVPDMRGAESHVLEQVHDILQSIGLEPKQASRVDSLISAGLQNLDIPYKPLHLRISALGVDYKNIPRLTQPDPLPGQSEEGGLGFFIVKRIVDQIGEFDQGAYRMVEVLIYRE
jgi:hypothetical protein